MVAASVPIATDGNADITGPAGMSIKLTDEGRARGTTLTAEDRAEMLKEIDEAPWFLQPMIRSFAEDPDAFRNKILTIMPRIFFGLLPVFAGIVALFYRARTFPTALVFATHLHAFAFLAFTISELAKATDYLPVAVGVGLAVIGVFLIYTLRAFRAVFGGGWPITMAKAAGVGIVYLFASVPAFIIILVWASLT